MIVILKLYGIKGLRSILRFNRITQHTVFWLLMVVLLPLSIILLSYYFAGVELASLLIILQQHFSFYLLLITGFIVSGGLAEEFGWRGFLLPQNSKAVDSHNYHFFYCKHLAFTSATCRLEKRTAVALANFITGNRDSSFMVLF
ncbi:hypothetical protein [Solitalea longa]|uniref:hypothetical protein n=1 Tax=Solitalea longa TaxID=2079460 RepID=UPI0013FE07A8|nr:hypothetical protein [Solitalea longa]